MLSLTFTEENYLKTIYGLQIASATQDVSVNAISEKMEIKPATVTDMLRKLSEKKLIHYEKYKRINLSEDGEKSALQIVRKHRLWETFLHDKLKFNWDEVHEVAEQLEHIHSQKLIARLDEMLDFPQYDPHGDPIPNAKGELPAAITISLNDGMVNHKYRLVSLKNSSPAFLQQLERLKFALGAVFVIKERMPYDNSILVHREGDGSLMLSEKVAENLLVSKFAG